MKLEKNIERIADALEALARTAGAQTPPERTGTVAPQTGQQPPMQQAPQGNWQGQQTPIQQAPQGGQVPVSLPAGMGAQWQGGAAQPGGMVQQPPGAGAVPTTATAQQYTFDQLAVATANLSGSGKDVFAILGRFGINMLMELPRERYGEFAAALREAGAVI